MKTLRVLIVEDDANDADLLLRQLRKAGFEVEYRRAETADGVKSALAEEEFDIVISDYGMRGFSGLDALEILQESGLDIPFIIVSGSIGEEAASTLMRLGVSDYVMKESLSRLAPAVTRELQEAENRREKREAEQALLRSEERLKVALNAAGLGAWEWDLITSDVFWSPEASVILGIPVAGSKIENILAMVFDEDMDLVREVYSTSLKNRRPFNFKLRLRRRDGEVVWAAVSGKAEFDDRGEAVRIVGTVRDITRDKKAEDALIEAEERYRVMAESASDAVISIDAQSNILYANPAVKRVFGYESHELVGEKLTILMPQATRPRHMAGVERYLETGEKRLDWSRTETTGRRKDGAEIAIQISFGHHKKGEQHFFTGFIRDISESKAAENAIRESEQNFRALVQATTKFVWQLDERANLTEYPYWWEELTGQPYEESRNFGWVECLHPDDRERVKSSYIEAIEGGKPALLELRIRGKQGDYRHYSGSGVPLPTDDGIRWICALSDITAQRTAEERYRLLSSMTTDYLFAASVQQDGSMKMEWVAGAFEAITGYAPDDFISGGVWRDIVHPDDVEKEDRDAAQVAANRPVDSELRIVRKDGKVIWVRRFAEPRWDLNTDSLIGAVGAVEDITVRKTAELAVRESEQRLRTILDTEPECVKVLDRVGRIIEINPAGAKILGFDDPSRLIGRTAEGIITPEYIDGFKAVIKSVIAGGSENFVYEVFGADEERRWLDMHAVPLRSVSGEISSVLGVSRDITEKRKIEASLRRSQGLYSDLIDSIEGIVWEADASTYEFTFVSRQAEAILGYKVEDWFRAGFWETLIHDEDRERAVRLCRAATAKGESHSFEYRMTAADGRTVWIRDIVTVVTEGGRPTLLRGLMVDVTEQRRKDAAMKRQALIIEQANEAIFVWDLEGGIVEWNKGCERLYGFTREEVIGRSSFDVLRSRLPRKRVQFINSLVQKGSWSGEVTQTTKAGRMVYADSQFQLIELDGRRVVLQTDRDMTASRKAENALRQSEMRYRHLFETNPYPMWVYDLESMRFLAVNDAAIYRYGYSAEEFMSMTLLDIHPPEEVERAREKIRSVKLKIESTGSWQHKKKDGSLMNVEITSHALEFEGKNARLVLAHDVSDRLRAEEAVKRSEAKYRELFENANDLIYTHDLTGKFTSLNHAGERVTGYTEEEALSMNIADVVVPEFLDRAQAMIERKVEGSPPTIYETEIIAKDGRRVPLEINTRLIFDGGKPIGVQGIGRDISERRAAEAALRASEEQLRQSQKLESIGILAGGMAHDFNNMLTAINGYSDLILRKLPPDDPIRNNVTEIRNAGERSAELTRQLLAFSRRQILQPRALDLNEVVEGTASLIQRLIGEDIKITRKLSADLWNVLADPGQLSQVLMNLSINARDAMPRGGSLVIETSNISLDGDYAGRHIDVRPGNYVMLAVSDTGSGMDEETRRRVFEPFFTTKPVGRGTGLGLSTVYGIVKQSGGNIWVYSEVGRGTTFKIYLPVADTTESTEIGVGGQGDLLIGSETVMLVEDEEAVRSLASEILRSCGYTVIEAANGIDALAKFEDSGAKVELLITDIVMPEMGGRELSEQIKADRPDIKVLFTSGYTDDAILRHGIIDEGTNFLQKPFTYDALSRKVRWLLDQN